jgi:hypothetical protein
MISEKRQKANMIANIILSDVGAPRAGLPGVFVLPQAGCARVLSLSVLMSGFE